jgi:hypothetical protein
MAGKRARIKDHIARGDMTEEEAQEWSKNGFKDRNMYLTIPEKPTAVLPSSDTPAESKGTKLKRFE